MRKLHGDSLQSVDQLREWSAEWDALWQRSDVALPTARAALTQQWIEQFAPAGRFRAITVRDGDRLVAALPLVGTGPAWRGAGHLPGNAWSAAGQLLLDTEADAPAVCDALVAQLHSLGWPLLVLDGPDHQAGINQFMAAVIRAGLPSASHLRFQIPCVEISGTWPDYFAGRSRNLRKQAQRISKLAEGAGPTELLVLDKLAGTDVDRWVERGFEIEDRSWKGPAGTSVRRSPGMLDFYRRQARQLAEWQQLRLVFLVHRGQPIAFEYGWLAKGVYMTPKVGFDEAFGRFSPGQLLRLRLIESMHASNDCRLVDFLGPQTRATDHWATSHYGLRRHWIALNPLGSATLWAKQQWRRLRRKDEADQVAPQIEPALAEV